MRPDYVPGKSDVDIDVFVKNPEQTIQTIKQCMGPGATTSSFVFKTSLNNGVVYGTKIKFNNIKTITSQTDQTAHTTRPSKQEQGQEHEQKKEKEKEKEKFIKTEISVYPHEYKNIVLHEHSSKVALPFYAEWMLVILKFLYYRLGVLSKSYYVPAKEFVLSSVIGWKSSEFVLLPSQILTNQN